MEPLLKKLDTSHLSFDFGRKASQDYYEQEVNGRGAESLVSLSNFSNFDSNTSVAKVEQMMHLQIAKLISHISRGDRDLLAGVLAKVEACVQTKCTLWCFLVHYHVANLSLTHVQFIMLP